MTPAARIVQLDLETLGAMAEGDLEQARRTSAAPLSAWLAGPDCVGTWRRRARQLVESPEDAAWVTGVVVADGRAVGRAGFHGAPEDGVVEVGYAIDPAHRRRGYGRAALVVMLARARADAGVRRVLASVSPGNAASLALVMEAGFVRTGEQWDDEDGWEWVFELAVEDPTSRRD